MIVPNSKQIKEIDDATIKERKISSAELMEESARAVASFIFQKYKDHDRPIVIFAGPGNNGGDGLALARIMNNRGYRNICVYLFNTNDSLSKDCKINKERLRNECEEVKVVEIVQQFEAPQIKKETLIIDALFGTGLNKPLNGGYAALVRFINSTHCEVVSIDLPSGLMCEDNTYNSLSSIVHATYTLTIGFPKLALFLADSQTFLGKVFLLKIGLYTEGLQEDEIFFHLTEKPDIQSMLKVRSPFGHKGTFGNALLIAGQYGMAGAAILAAKSCLRSGVGKVTIHTPLRNNDILQVTVPEAVIHHDEDNNYFTSTINADSFQALAVGPGIGTNKKTALAFIEQVSHTTTPLVVDADAINILATHRGWISQVPQNAIFTPHQREMQRLGICNSDSFSTLLEAVNMAKQYAFYIVLKGHYTAVCTPNGQVYFNPTGNSGMATAGSGDVLTGIILALCAQKYTAEKACRLGVFLHGLAGDLAAKERGEYSLTASDIIDYLPKAFAELGQETAMNTQDSFQQWIEL